MARAISGAAGARGAQTWPAWAVAAGALVPVAVAAGAMLVRRARRRRELRARAQAKRERIAGARLALDAWVAEHAALVPSLAEQRRIAQLGAAQLAAEIRAGKVTAVGATVTACLRARRAGELLNSNADERFLFALDLATAADAKLKAEGPTACGPLHGVPVSIKDNIDLRHADSTNGLMARCLAPSEANAALVEALLAAGAIPFVKGNVPQLLMVPETVNNVFGRALNPWNARRSPGGSSGGEAALVASYCSFLGIGTDIGGSIRTPCHFCGIVGFKPTSQRVSLAGCKHSSDLEINGQISVRAAAGPMARNVEDLRLALQVLWAADSPMFGADPYTVPTPWRDLRPRSRRIGWFVEDGFFDTAPACARAVLVARDALAGIGYELVPFSLPAGDAFVKLFISAISADGKLRYITSGMSGEPLLKEYRSSAQIAGIGPASRQVLASILDRLGETRKAIALRAGGFKTVAQHWKTNAELVLYRKACTTAFQAADLDVLICPGGTLPALTHGASEELAISQSVNFLFNVLDWPSGIVPVTLAEEDEGWDASKLQGRDKWFRLAAQQLDGAGGLPVGIQVVGLPHHDELCLHVMSELEQAVRPSGPVLPLPEFD